MRLIHRVAHTFATDPHFQYRFNLICTVVWIGLMVLAPLLPVFNPVVHTSDQWGSHTIVDLQRLAALLIFEVSLWANAFTHFGALGANLAAIFATNLPSNGLADLQAQADDTQTFLDEPAGNSDWLDDEYAEELINAPEREVPIMNDVSKLTGS